MYCKDESFRSRASTPLTASLGDSQVASVAAGIGILELAQVVPASDICGPYLKTPTFSIEM